MSDGRESPVAEGKRRLFACLYVEAPPADEADLIDAARRGGALPDVGPEDGIGRCLLFMSAAEALAVFDEIARPGLRAGLAIGEAVYSRDPKKRAGDALNQGGHVGKSLGETAGLRVTDEVYRGLAAAARRRFRPGAPVRHGGRAIATWDRPACASEA